MAIDRTQKFSEAQLSQEIWGSAFGSPDDFRYGQMIDNHPTRTTVIASIVFATFLLAMAIGLAYVGSMNAHHLKPILFSALISGTLGLVALGILAFVVKYVASRYWKKLSAEEALRWLETSEKELNQVNEIMTAQAKVWFFQANHPHARNYYKWQRLPQHRLEEKETVWDVHYRERTALIATAKKKYGNN